MTREDTLQRKVDELHEVYRQFWIEKMTRKSWNYKKQMISLLVRLPPPEELTREWILNWLNTPSPYTGKPLSNDSVYQYLTRIDVLAGWMKREDLFGIEKPKKRELTREEIIEAEEIRRLIKHAPNSRARALIHILAETGARIDEVLSIKIENMVVDGSGARVVDGLNDAGSVLGRMWKITVSRSKTQIRALYVYHSTPSILAWLMDHPVKRGPLFISEKRARIGGALQYVEINYGTAYKDVTQAYVNTGYRDDNELRRLNKMEKYLQELKKGKVPKTRTREERTILNMLQEQALTIDRIQELINQQLARPPIVPRRIHTFRHFKGTELEADNVSKKKKNRIMGWSEKSNAGDRYSHLVDEDIEREMRIRFGLVEDISRTSEEIESWRCPVCGHMNSPSTAICINCPPKPDPLEDRLSDLQAQIEQLQRQAVEDTPEIIEKKIEEKVREALRKSQVS
jgi:integrase